MSHVTSFSCSGNNPICLVFTRPEKYNLLFILYFSPTTATTTVQRISYQGSLDALLPQQQHETRCAEPTALSKADVESIAKHVADNVAKILGRSSTSQKGEVRDVLAHVANFEMFLDEFPDFEIRQDGAVHVLRCLRCYSYISSPLDRRSDARKVATSSKGSIASGLPITGADYEKLVKGHCQKWYDMKFKLSSHIACDTHFLALQHSKAIREGEKRRLKVVKNQLRTTLGVIKSKSAALHYETRLAELHAAGADIGDFGHSRKLFPAMTKAACAFIDNRTKQFLTTPLENTGMLPHFYVTADKSTNHRVVNQATMICPVVCGKRQAIPLSITAVYGTSDGDTGRGEKLAEAILSDLRKHAGISDGRLMQMQGKCTDGQYLNLPFSDEMNKPIRELLKKYEDEMQVDMSHLSDEFWWPVQWDPGHWLDKVFGAFRTTPFVDRLLKRTSLYHQMFGYGKMHAVAKETAKELELPFRVTTSFAQQRFMSSSYLSLKNLAVSLEAYIEAYKDHDNRLDIGYKLYGQDFCVDLLGLLDVLWPVVLLMLEGQAQWCPGWKFARYLPKAEERISNVVTELRNDKPSKSVCPWLGNRLQEIKKLRYGKSELEVGWLVVEEKDGMPVEWEAREVEDCLHDLRKLGGDICDELRKRYDSSFSELNILLAKCLDFGILMVGLCGKRGLNETGSIPVNKGDYSRLGLVEFKKCAKFVADLPHVREMNLEINEEFAFTVFWKLKSALIEVVWGNLFETHFQKFFVDVSPSGKQNDGRRAIPKNLTQPGVRVVEFESTMPEVFTLAEVFTVRFSNGDEKTVSLQEHAVIEALYTDTDFYTLVGQEFCIIFDIMYAKTGTEAVVESLYRVVEKQEMDGGQSISTLAARAKIDWCFPSLIQCDAALESMAKLYIEGDKELSLSRHYVPVYKDKRSVRNLSKLSIVLERMKGEEVKLPFLL